MKRMKWIYDVTRTSFDCLQSELNCLGFDGWEVFSISYIDGITIVSKKQVECDC